MSIEGKKDHVIDAGSHRLRWVYTGRTWIGWGVAFTAITVGMARVRPDIEQAHVVLVYLLLVLGGSVSGGRPLGFTLAALAFSAIDYWFQQPYDTLTVAKPLDWLVLFAFLATAMVTTQLLARARNREAEARRHAANVERLAKDVQHAEALREADRFKNELLTSVSHDFRTPLTTIKALAHDVSHATAVQAEPNLSRSMMVIEEQADWLAHLVDNVLDFSRIRSGSLAIAPQLNTAEDLIGAAIRQVKGVLGDRALEIDIDWNAPALMGYFDFSYALRALGNLL
jgi:K+-sensing histidine kinase KdpD